MNPLVSNSLRSRLFNFKQWPTLNGTVLVYAYRRIQPPSDNRLHRVPIPFDTVVRAAPVAIWYDLTPVSYAPWANLFQCFRLGRATTSIALFDQSSSPNCLFKISRILLDSTVALILPTGAP